MRDALRELTASPTPPAQQAAQGEPVPSDQSRWCAYVGGMVAHWITSEPDAHARLGDDKFEAAIAGIIERRLWAMPTQDTTPPAPQPAPVDELIEALGDLMDWQVKNVALWHNRAYDRAHRAIKKHRAALQSSAPQTKGQS